MVEKKLSNSQEVVHFKHLCAELPVHILHLFNTASLHTQQGNQDGSCACATNVVKHLVSFQATHLLQVLEESDWHKSPVCGGDKMAALLPSQGIIGSDVPPPPAHKRTQQHQHHSVRMPPPTHTHTPPTLFLLHPQRVS